MSSFSLNCYFFFKRANVAGNLLRTEKTVLVRWADSNNRQKLHISGLGNICRPFFFEFSKVNVLKINLTKIILIYPSVNHLIIFQHLFLIYATVNHIGILQRQLDDGSCFHSAQSLTKLILLIKNRYFIFLECNVAIKCT